MKRLSVSNAFSGNRSRNTKADLLRNGHDVWAVISDLHSEIQLQRVGKENGETAYAPTFLVQKIVRKFEETTVAQMDPEKITPFLC